MNLINLSIRFVYVSILFSFFLFGGSRRTETKIGTWIGYCCGEVCINLEGKGKGGGRTVDYLFIYFLKLRLN